MAIAIPRNDWLAGNLEQFQGPAKYKNPYLVAKNERESSKGIKRVKIKDFIFKAHHP